MASRRYIVAYAASLALLLGAPAPVLGAAGSSATVKAHRAASALLRSRALWATINLCNPKDQPDTVGIRGSMPGDGQTHDKMFMSFRLQYLSGETKHWADLGGTAIPGFIAVGSGTARQGGQSFQLMPVAGKPAFELRGLVEFQWRRGKKVLESTRRATTAPHKSLAGADPLGFSAATCLIG
jgi:hypothetical protein